MEQATNIHTKKVAVITSVKPNPLNNANAPSGLIWEVINTLHKYHVRNQVCYICESKNKVRQLLCRYGIYWRKINISFEEYDKIIIYPENLVMAIPNKYREKVIILGPDSPSLRDARLYKIIKKYKLNWRKYFTFFCYLAAQIHEYRILKSIKRFLVVGKTDRIWMEQNPYVRRNEKMKQKIKFIYHPILTQVVRKRLPFKNVEKKRFIFSGDLDKRFNFEFIFSLYKELKKGENDGDFTEMDIVIVGGKNKWIADILNQVQFMKVQYIKWIKDYNNVCVIGQDVHCLPLLVGAGTKNRALTALANGLEVISTPIGIENISYKGLSSVYITRNPKRFVAYMMKLNQSVLSKSEMKSLIQERVAFREKVHNLYESSLKTYMID